LRVGEIGAAEEEIAIVSGDGEGAVGEASEAELSGFVEKGDAGTLGFTGSADERGQPIREVFEGFPFGSSEVIGFVAEEALEHGAGESLNAIAPEDGPENEAVAPGEFLSGGGGALFAFGGEDGGGDKCGFDEEFFPEGTEDFAVQVRCE